MASRAIVTAAQFFLLASGDLCMAKTIKMLMLALIAAFTLSSVAEAAPKKTRHRAKHGSRVASGAAPTTGLKPAAKRKGAAGAHAKAGTSTRKSTTRKAPAKQRPATKPR
jgi:hypothetical protein